MTRKVANISRQQFEMLPITYRSPYFWFFCSIITALIYSPTLNSPFLLDDSHTLSSNAFVQSVSSFSSIWSTGRAYSSQPATYGYRPVTTTMNMILWIVGGGETWPFHVMKILLFLLTCWLAVHIWRELTPAVPDEVLTAAILLFALNPAHSQVVSYIAAIATQWAALFICCSALSYLYFRKTQVLPWLMTSLICSLLAILSKEEGIVILGLIPLVEIYRLKIEGAPSLFSRQSRRRLGFIMLFLIPGIIGLGLIIGMFEPTQNLVRTDTSTWTYFVTQWRAYLRYFATYFYSYELNADNLEFGFSTHFWKKYVLIALLLNALLLTSVIFYWRPYPALTLSIFWFYIGVSPASSVVVLSEPVNDHRAFIGYLGFTIFLILILNWLYKKNRHIFMTGLVFISFIYGVMTYQRGDVWRTNENFWRDIVAKNPSSARAYNNLGLEMIHQYKYQQALALLERCGEIQPTYPPCYINRAVAFSRIGRDLEAEQEFEKAVRFDRGIIQSRYNWARFLNARGIFSKAQILLKEADNFAQGTNLEVRLALIEVLRQKGDLASARKLFNEAVSTFGRRSQFLVESQRLNVDY